MKIIKTIEDSAHHFLIDIKKEASETKEATLIIEKYIKVGNITDKEEVLLKTQLIDSLKIVGVIIPFVLIPGASILMPILIKVAKKHDINILPTAFNN